MTKHFIDKDFPFQATVKRLPDDVYGQALDRLVISTLDIVVVNPKGEILIGKRSFEPMKGVFFLIGGGRRRGESFGQTAARILKTELGIVAKPGRFEEFGVYSLAFARRRQAPQDHGVHTDGHTFLIKLTDAEIAKIKPNQEYSQTLWIAPAQVVKRADEFHEALVQICKDKI